MRTQKCTCRVAHFFHGTWAVASTNDNECCGGAGEPAIGSADAIDRCGWDAIDRKQSERSLRLPTRHRRTIHLESSIRLPTSAHCIQFAALHLAFDFPVCAFVVTVPVFHCCSTVLSCACPHPAESSPHTKRALYVRVQILITNTIHSAPENTFAYIRWVPAILVSASHLVLLNQRSLTSRPERTCFLEN